MNFRAIAGLFLGSLIIWGLFLWWPEGIVFASKWILVSAMFISLFYIFIISSISGGAGYFAILKWMMPFFAVVSGLLIWQSARVLDYSLTDNLLFILIFLVSFIMTIFGFGTYKGICKELSSN